MIKFQNFACNTKRLISQNNISTSMNTGLKIESNEQVSLNISFLFTLFKLIKDERTNMKVRGRKAEVSGRVSARSD